MKSNSVIKTWSTRGIAKLGHTIGLNISKLHELTFRYNICNIFCALMSNTTRNALAEVRLYKNRCPCTRGNYIASYL